ncbi:MAG: 3-phosphoserine/phosphohydroxythreonine transaminase [Nitrospirae bacterium]|nr:3-phosphoserine/phosphohydroxythreonine transaminase [Nitrospirota bacterium]
MSRIYNFSAGPAMLPLEVLERAQSEMVEYRATGMSVMEMSHRGKDYMAIIAKAEADLREIMAIPANYKVLFLQGGASSQFSMIPMNLLRGKTKADYINTGMWSKKAIAEAKRYCTVNVPFSSEDTNFSRVPRQDELKLDADAAYCHMTSNNTIFGTEFHYTPDTGSVPLVADMSSNILSKPIDVSKYGLIYAGAQKNIGPSGLTIVIVREDLVGQTLDFTPAMFKYDIHVKNDSMYNTPPTYGIYIAGLVFEWLKEKGGIAAMEQVNIRKAAKLYGCIDGSGFYRCPTEKESRSRMNVPFTLANAELDEKFLSEAKGAGLVTLKGHRSVGGMRASIYNAMPEAGIDALVSFMEDFAKRNG